MPKEVVRDHSGGGFNVEVRWRGEGGEGAGDGHVQIGVTMIDPQVSNQPQNLKQLVDSWENEGNDPDQPGGSMGLFVSPGRYELNRLIRALRRARDQAYGADA